jgi:hypothetical protein
VVSVTQIGNARKLTPGPRRHWVRFGEVMLISDEKTARNGALAICQPIPGEPLLAILQTADGKYAGEIDCGGEMIIQIHDLKLIVAVRAVERGHALIEIGVPHGDRVKIAFEA